MACRRAPAAFPHIVLALAVATGLGVARAAADEPLAPAAVAFFETKIRPVLVERCYECHATDADVLQGGLLLDSREGVRAGGDSGPAVVPGEPGESVLLEALRYESFEMPPDGKLADETIADFERWIAMGAPDPRTRRGRAAAACG